MMRVTKFSYNGRREASLYMHFKLVVGDQTYLYFDIIQCEMLVQHCTSKLNGVISVKVNSVRCGIGNRESG